MSRDVIKIAEKVKDFLLLKRPSMPIGLLQKRTSRTQESVCNLVSCIIDDFFIAVMSNLVSLIIASIIIPFQCLSCSNTLFYPPTL